MRPFGCTSVLALKLTLKIHVRGLLLSFEGGDEVMDKSKEAFAYGVLFLLGNELDVSSGHPFLCLSLDFISQMHAACLSRVCVLSVCLKDL